MLIFRLRRILFIVIILFFLFDKAIANDNATEPYFGYSYDNLRYQPNAFTDFDRSIIDGLIGDVLNSNLPPQKETSEQAIYYLWYDNDNTSVFFEQNIADTQFRAHFKNHIQKKIALLGNEAFSLSWHPELRQVIKSGNYFELDLIAVVVNVKLIQDFHLDITDMSGIYAPKYQSTTLFLNASEQDNSGNLFGKTIPEIDEVAYDAVEGGYLNIFYGKRIILMGGSGALHAGNVPAAGKKRGILGVQWKYNDSVLPEKFYFLKIIEQMDIELNPNLKNAKKILNDTFTDKYGRSFSEIYSIGELLNYIADFKKTLKKTELSKVVDINKALYARIKKRNIPSELLLLPDSDINDVLSCYSNSPEDCCFF